MWRRERGVALVFSIVLVAVLSMTALEFAFQRQVESAIALNHANDLKALYQSEAGIQFAIALLKADDPTFDGPGELWARRIGALPVGDGWASWKITDESGMINLNRLLNRDGSTNRQLAAVMERLMLLLDMDPAVIPALLDWIDTDGEVRFHGAEDADYEARGSRCKDAPLDAVEELVFIKGFDEKAVEKLRPFVTLNSDGKVNLNTAPPLVLQAMVPSMDEEVAKEIVRIRSERTLRSPAELSEVRGISLTDLANLRALGTVRTSYFSIEASGMTGESSRIVHVTVKRKSGGEVEPLVWRIEK